MSTAANISYIGLEEESTTQLNISANGGTFILDPQHTSEELIYNIHWKSIQSDSLIIPGPQQGNKLVGTGSTGSSQGTFVSLSADGNTLVVADGNSPPQSVFTNMSNTASAWVFKRSNSIWSQQGQYLSGTGFTGIVELGVSTCISADGNTIALGGPDDGTGIGATWIFTQSGGIWSQYGDKLIGTGYTGTPQQGTFVSLSANGDILAIGGENDNTNIGATWIFENIGGIWTQQGLKLVGTGSTGTVKQGSSVSLSSDGNTLAVGGPADNGNIGATWIFENMNGNWIQQGDKLVGTGYLFSSFQGSDVSLSSDGNTLAIGGDGDNSDIGATWIFTRSNGIWSQQGSKLVGTGYTGSESNQGYSVSLSADGNTLAVGGMSDNSSVGSTWIFLQSNGNWIQQGNKIVGTGYTGTPFQGLSVSLSADANTLAIGGPGDSTATGATWIFSSNEN